MPSHPSKQKRLLGTPASRQPAGRRRYSRFFATCERRALPKTIYETRDEFQRESRFARPLVFLNDFPTVSISYS